MRVAGIDPGTVHLGVCVLESAGPTQSVLFTKRFNFDARRKISERLHQIHTSLLSVFREWQPEVVAIENVFHHIDFKAAIRIGEARAAAIIAAAECGISIAEYLPTRVKQSICGNGRAAKAQVQFMIQKILKLPNELDSDSSDALAVALCHLHSHKFETLKERILHV